MKERERDPQKQTCFHLAPNAKKRGALHSHHVVVFSTYFLPFGFEDSRKERTYVRQKNYSRKRVFSQKKLSGQKKSLLLQFDTVVTFCCTNPVTPESPPPFLSQNLSLFLLDASTKRQTILRLLESFFVLGTLVAADSYSAAEREDRRGLLLLASSSSSAGFSNSSLLIHPPPPLKIMSERGSLFVSAFLFGGTIMTCPFVNIRLVHTYRFSFFLYKDARPKKVFLKEFFLFLYQAKTLF